MAACWRAARTNAGVSRRATYWSMVRTASGGANGSNRMLFGDASTAATPAGTVVDVRNESNGRVVRVRINDRGPFVAGRIVDLSKAAAAEIDAALGAVERGLSLVLPLRQRDVRAWHLAPIRLDGEPLGEGHEPDIF